MKRKTVKTVLCAALLTIAMSATACGGSDDAAKSADAAVEEASVEEEAPAEEEASVEEEDPVEEEAPAEEESSGQKTLEEYMFEDPTAEQQLKEQAAAQGNDQMDMDIQVKGNEVICIATFKDSVELPDDVSEQLSEGMDSLGSAFSAIAGMLDDAIGAEKGTVSYGIRYCAPDGTVLAEASFTAE
ncbi:MAG: DUF4854 domain-containing protein [Lachnospiraceae bacterium]|nr:DUF4854 domain-containing protein [Lachnospiraceae bacterium]